MIERSVMEILKRTGAIINGHFVYRSGRHGTEYIDKREIFPHPKETFELSLAIAIRFREYDVETVIGPAMGAVIMAHLVAGQLTDLRGKEVIGVYAEKETISIPDPDGRGRRFSCDTEEFVIRNNYRKYIEGKNVLVVEDILNTGRSAKGVVKAVRNCGGTVIGVSALCNRGDVTSTDLGHVQRLVALSNLAMVTLSEDDCILSGPCSLGIPIDTTVGYGREFLARMA